MQKIDGRLRFSPSDLIEYIKSPYASWMSRQFLEHPESLTPDPEDEQLAMLARRGIEHEADVLNKMKVGGMDVVEITGKRNLNSTLAALEAGRQVIFQGYLAAGKFAGYADFLIRAEKDESSQLYEVWDTKLARHVKPYFIVQLCCYADILEQLTGHLTKRIGVILGTGERRSFETQEFIHYYRHVKNCFLDMMEAYPDGGRPDPEAAGEHGRWKSIAEAWLEDVDHLSRVANISRGQIVKLEKAGVRTMNGLAKTKIERVKGISQPAFDRLKEQAGLQVASADARRPRYKILEPPPEAPHLGLAALPPASELDVYFDMEGFPSGDEWLEYLFGAVVLEEGKPVFKDWWAHDARSERRVFEAFIKWAYDRWQRDKGMHIYHYAAYETTAIKRLMTTYATREFEVDELLRNAVFVDLYPIVVRGVRVGEPRYSIKNLEHLYMERQGRVTDAVASIVFYEKWRESGEAPDWSSSPILRAIRDYNEDDCISTWMLTQWLRERQRENGYQYISPNNKTTAEKSATEQEPEPSEAEVLAESMLAVIPAEDADRLSDRERWETHELLALLLQFHRREDKPMWWRFFERQVMTTEELADDLDCLAGIKRLPGVAEVAKSLEFTYQFDPDQDTKLRLGARVSLVPNVVGPIQISSFSPDGSLKLKISKAKLKKAELEALPEFTSLIPYEHVPADVIERAIFEIANDWVATACLGGALADFLGRRRPVISGSTETGSLLQIGEDLLEGAIRIATAMNSSCLCIQGPPGTGKTYVGARVIAELLQRGKKVGIASNSHKAICNLMAEVCEVNGPKSPVVKVGGDTEEPLLEPYHWVEHSASPANAIEDFSALKSGLIGGTAWLFSRADIKGALDYLFVDEAGQVCIANLVGMSRSAKNLVLMGDQMQLGQPIQGSHPGESGESALEYYLQGHATIPDDRGLFLGTSYRMHPNVCQFISEAVYESRLRSAGETANRVIAVPENGAQHITEDSGVVFCDVPHEGNVQGSDEEVDAILQLTKELLGRTLYGKDGSKIGKLKQEHIMYVAPYNLQVRRLQKALGADAKVGSVDKFQGQEAPVVIISMCASPGEFGPRGMEFVLDKNRLNVAISRAQSLAVVVGDGRLINCPVNNVANMQRMSLYARVLDS